MPLIHIYSDGVLEHVESRIRFAPQWIPKLIQREIKRTGGAALKNMQSMLGRNYYTGALMRSVKAEYDSKGYRVTISPTAQRGKWDAGLILEFGTGPITHAPWAPIARWAGTKGAPMPGTIIKIRTKGVEKHPFLDDTMNATKPVIDFAVAQIARGLAISILYESLE